MDYQQNSEQLTNIKTSDNNHKTSGNNRSSYDPAVSDDKGERSLSLSWVLVRHILLDCNFLKQCMTETSQKSFYCHCQKNQTKTKQKDMTIKRIT